MKALAIIGAASLMLAVASGAALAGKPDDPGAHGNANADFNKFLKENDLNPGQTRQAIADAQDKSWGQILQDAKDALGGAPNH